MPSLLAFFKRHALDESVRLSTLSFYGWVYASLMVGIAIGAIVAALS